MAPVGDVDGDGLGDLLVGAPSASGLGNGVGRAYLLLGSSVAAGGSLDLSLADVEFAGREPVPIDLMRAGWTGHSVGGAGDVDGDGLGDLLIGAPTCCTSNGALGEVYVLLSPS